MAPLQSGYLLITVSEYLLITVLSIGCAFDHSCNMHSDLYTTERKAVTTNLTAPPLITKLYKTISWMTTCCLWCWALTCLCELIAHAFSAATSCGNIASKFYIMLIVLFLQCAKCSTYILYILRLHECYAESPVGYGTKKLIGIGIFVIITMSIYGFGKLIGLALCPCADRQNGTTVFTLFAELSNGTDFMVAIFGIIFFIIPIKRLLKTVRQLKVIENQNESIKKYEQILSVGRKYKLCVITVSFTSIIMIVLIFCIKRHIIIDIFSAIYYIINMFCIILMSPYYCDKYFQRLCCWIINNKNECGAHKKRNNLRLNIECTDFLDCRKLFRLKQILEYYSEWQTDDVDDEKHGMYEYIKSIKIESIKSESEIEYSICTLLEDYHHLIHNHSLEFEEIHNKLFTTCNLKSCQNIVRNHRNRNIESNRCKIYYEYKNRMEVITQQILDQIHCYVYHIFDMQRVINRDHFRSRINAENNNKFMSDSDNDNMYSFGVRFYYDCDKYKDNNKFDLQYNKGYRYNDWFIPKKYANLKTELLQNKICVIRKPYYKDLYFKAKEYLKSKHVLKFCRNIAHEYLVSIMVYCNCNKFQNEFTKTFRYDGNNESMFSLKKRHSEFACLGHILRQTVEISGIAIEFGQTKQFYHGINIENMMFTSTLHKFYGPLSTSSSYEVALLFTNNNGIILELHDGTLLSNDKECRYFNCEWLSDFGYEQEKFFLGGKDALKIVNITNIKLNESYGEYIKLISILLAIIDGDVSIEMNDLKPKAMMKLLQHQLNAPKLPYIPQYVTKLLNHICINVKIVVTRYEVTFGSSENKKYKDLGEYLCYNDCQLFKLDLIFQLFPNLQTIAIGRSHITLKVFENILKFVKSNVFENQKYSNFKCIVLQSPTSHFMSYAKIEEKYGVLFNQIGWNVKYEKDQQSKLKRLIIHANKQSPHDHQVSNDVREFHVLSGQTELLFMVTSLTSFSDGD